MLGTDEGIIFGSNVGELLRFTLVPVDGFTLGLDEGTELSSSDGSFGGSNEGTVLGSSDDALDGTRDGILE